MQGIILLPILIVVVVFGAAVFRKLINYLKTSHVFCERVKHLESKPNINVEKGIKLFV